MYGATQPCVLEVTSSFALYWAIISIETYRFYSVILSYCWTGQILFDCFFSGAYYYSIFGVYFHSLFISIRLLFGQSNSTRKTNKNEWYLFRVSFCYRTHYCGTCRVIIILRRDATVSIRGDVILCPLLGYHKY